MKPKKIQIDLGTPIEKWADANRGEEEAQLCSVSAAVSGGSRLTGWLYRRNRQLGSCEESVASSAVGHRLECWHTGSPVWRSE